MSDDFQQDLDAVADMDFVPTILDIICHTTGMRFAAVARVTDDRWIACRSLDQIEFGLVAGGELDIGTTICQEVRNCREAVIIDHVDEDERYRAHPTPALFGFQSYISMPIIRADGSFFGTLCALDPLPAKVSHPSMVGMFALFARLIASHLDNRDQADVSRSALLDEQRVAELREQFIAVLGHDLRNPVASINAGTRMLLKTPLDEKAKSIVKLMQSSIIRMSGLIDNVLDFARGRLGDGISLNSDAREPLEPVLRAVVEEVRSIEPDRAIEVEFQLDQAFDCDRQRLAQLLSNLLGNAVTHGSDAAPVRVRGVTENGVFELSVSNSGEPISESEMAYLFQPFARGKLRASQQGLGLGLYIASQIARAHGGDLTVATSAQETRFTFRMNLDDEIRVNRARATPVAGTPLIGLGD